VSYYLSKSDFILALDCPAKLYYKKKSYPTLDDDNEYLHHLARGGYMVGKYATLHYPDGIDIDTGSDHSKAVELTKEYLARENVTLFEAAIESSGKLIRIDILEKKGKSINLIEVKSKSFDSGGDPAKEIKALDNYILDAAYQYYVIKEAYPDFNIKPLLYLPDKNKNTSVEGLNLLFRITQCNTGTSFRKYEVSINDERISDIINDDLMTLLDVSERVLELQPFVREEAVFLIESLEEDLKKIPTTISKDCFGCEYNAVDETHPVSGFSECWSGYPDVDHHIMELYHIGTIGGWKNPTANRWIEKKMINLLDIPISELTGKRGERQLIQITNTRENKEWIGGLMKSEIVNWEYPLHFIDFETTLTALPFHKGMRPYEVVAFQWSCHTIKKENAGPVHSEWINLDPAFPNFRFAETLMDQIGIEGTPLMWAPYENTILKTIYHQMEKFNYTNIKLKTWLEYMVKFDKHDEGRFVDMNKLALDHYFHPAMKGKTSIKWTLPAVLRASESLRIQNWLQNFGEGLSLWKKDENGELINPYKLLPVTGIYEKAESVKDGTGAMRAYEDLMFGLNKDNPQVLNDYKQALLRYCRLDTLAMVIIWEHWRNK
jgi:hypothetical protein